GVSDKEMSSECVTASGGGLVNVAATMQGHAAMAAVETSNAQACCCFGCATDFDDAVPV
ncbi:hypothetical protein L195_g035118, partial [Trifolium pratense]